MPADNFVHLHVHTEYSTLDGANRIPEIMAKAAKYEMPALAMTDHGNLYGIVDFYQQAKKFGVKPIFGCEIYLAPGSMHEKKQIPGKKNATHLTVLAKDDLGFSNLVKLVSKAHLEGFYYKPRVDKECLAEYSEGLLALSGCLASEVNQHIINDQNDLARGSINDFINIFGKDDFYLEIHDHGLEAQHKCTKQMIEFSKEFDLKLVAANDVHFLNRADHECHDVMICIGTGVHVHDEKRLHYPEEVYFKSQTEMYDVFKDVPEACRNTLEIAEKCNVELKLDSTSSEKYPEFDSPDGSPRDEYFRKLCQKGLVERYGEERAANDPELAERLEYEIGIMTKMGFVSYFLITWDFIDWAKRHKIPVGPGRGSAAGSLVAYVLGITDLCPLKFGLIFERFLNPERVSPPDVDVDFCQARRGEVIEYVRQKYGERAVSHIVTFGTLGAKSVIRDVGRVLGMGYTEADRIAKMIPAELGITLSEAREKNPELAEAIEKDGRVQDLWKYATYLEGLTRGTGIHAAGVVIGDRPLDEFIPLTRGNEGEVVTQLAMGPLTEFGMLKMDFLGLKTLTVIQDAVNLLYEFEPDFDITKIPTDDRPTYDLLSAGETVAVFQLESGGMINLCKQFGVDDLEDISALLALYRPGPMDLIPDYIARKKGEKEIVYEHPLLEGVASNTYGIMIYQEQVQKAANVLAGYSLGQADLLRRAMGKKDKAKMAIERQQFVAGCAATNKIAGKKANKIFDLLEKFAGYGFNKSHSCAYGLITYQTAFLKANFPVEFMSGVLSNEINNTEKISVFVNECKNMGIDILPPNINRSQIKFAPERVDGASQNGRDGRDKAIRYGLAAIKGVGQGAMEMVLKNRDEEGEFTSLENFATRVDSKSVNKKVMESLIKGGAFDFTGEERPALYARIGQVVASSQAATKDRSSGQTSLFDTVDITSAAPETMDHEPVEKWTQDEILAFEKELLGFYVTGHPLDSFRNTILSKASVRSYLDLEELPTGKDKKQNFIAFVSSAAIKYTKAKGLPFAILITEDLYASAEVLVWNDVFEKT
ncbi:MAG: DNA polymerase-3 subunit alpha, partial [Verrucomicrobiales bacterium]